MASLAISVRRSKRNERIVGARVDHFAAHTLFDQRAQALGDVQNQVLLRADRSGPMVPVSCPPWPGSSTMRPTFRPSTRIIDRSPEEFRLAGKRRFDGSRAGGDGRCERRARRLGNRRGERRVITGATGLASTALRGLAIGANGSGGRCNSDGYGGGGGVLRDRSSGGAAGRLPEARLGWRTGQRNRGRRRKFAVLDGLRRG